MSAELRARVEDYLRIRRALGFKLEDHGRMLPAFVSYLEHTGASTFTVEAALGWATQPLGVQPYRWKQRLSVVRGFARYLHALDPRCRCRRATCLSIAAAGLLPTCFPTPTSPGCCRPPLRGRDH